MGLSGCSHDQLPKMLFSSDFCLSICAMWICANLSINTTNIYTKSISKRFLRQYMSVSNTRSCSPLLVHKQNIEPCITHVLAVRREIRVIGRLRSTQVLHHTTHTLIRIVNCTQTTYLNFFLQDPKQETVALHMQYYTSF